MASRGPSFATLMLMFGLGVVAAGAFSLSWFGWVRDEFGLGSHPLLDWSWFPFLAGLILVAATVLWMVITALVRTHARSRL